MNKISSNTLKIRGKKGSKFWMQTIINSDMKLKLENQIAFVKSATVNDTSISFYHYLYNHNF